MTKMNRFIAGLFLVLGLIAPLMSVNAETTREDIQNAAQVCLDDYYNVVLNIRNPEMRRAYFSDMFTMTQCQLNDVLPLYDEYEAIKDQFRADASNCGTLDNYKALIAEHELDLKRILLEVHFIRNVRSTAKKDEINRDRELILKTLYNDMYDAFVNGSVDQMVGPDDFDDMWVVWVDKYSDSITNYGYCEEGAVWELYESWFSFQETIQSLDISVDMPERKSFKEVITPDVNANVDIDSDAIQTLKEAGQGLAGGAKVVLDTGKYFFDHIANRVTNRTKISNSSLYYNNNPGNIEYNGSYGFSLPEIEEGQVAENNFPTTFSDYIEALNSATDTNQIYTDSDLRMAEYYLLYGEVSAVSTTNIAVTLDQMNNVIINNNLEDFPAIRESLSEIYGKQCK